MQPSGNPYLDTYRSSASYGQAPTASQPATSAPTTKGPGGIKGWLINNAPAIGGGLGAIAGIPLDFLGGAGSIAGGAAGAAAGEQLKQNLLGNGGSLGHQLEQDAVQGGESALLGGIGKGLGAASAAAKGLYGISKAAPTVAELGADTSGAVAKSSGGIFKNLVNNAATKEAQTSYATKVNSEFGLPGTLDKGTNGTPINQVLSNLQSHRIEPTVTNMAKYGNAGYAYNDFLNNAIVPKGNPVQLSMDKVIGDAFKGQPGLGAVAAKGTQANQIASGLRNTLADSLDPQSENISGTYHPGDLIKAAQDLYSAQPQNQAEAAVYAKARASLLDAAGKEGGLNAAIEKTKLPSVQDALGNDNLQNTFGQLPGTSTVQHFVNSAGGNATLAQEMVDNVNKAGSIQDIQKAEIPHIAANDIASSAASAAGRALPEAPSGGANIFSSSGSPAGNIYAANELIRNPLVGVPVAAAKYGGGLISKQLAKLGAADASQVGPRAIPSLGNVAESTVAPTAENAASSGVASPVPTNPMSQAANVLGGTPTFKAAATGASNQLPTFAKGASLVGNAAKGTGGFAARVATAPLAHPVAAPLSVFKQYAGRNIGSLVGALAGGTPQASATPDVASTGQLGGALDQEAQSATQPAENPQYPEANMLADIQKDPKNASTYETLYKDLNASNPATALTTNQKNTISGLQAAVGSLTPYAQQLQGITNAGPAGGRVESVLGKLGLGGANAASIAALDSSRTEIATQIAKALTGSKPAASIIKSWEDTIPNVNDPVATRNAKWEQFAQRLQGELEQAQQPVGDPSQASSMLSQLGAQ